MVMIFFLVLIYGIYIVNITILGDMYNCCIDSNDNDFILYLFRFFYNYRTFIYCYIFKHFKM
jgi:hypothetical protein